MENAASGNNRTVEWFFNVLSTHSNEIRLISFILGMIMKLIFGGDINDFTFFTVITLLTMFGVFFDLLHVDLSRKIVYKVPSRVWIFSIVTFVLRWVVFGTVLWSTLSSTSNDDSGSSYTKNEIILTRWAVLWMLPPSISTIRESRCMGGDLYPSAVLSILLNTILPLLLIAYLQICPDTLVDTERLNSFLVILFVAFLLPCIMANLIRKANPVWSVHLRSNWNWLGEVSRLIGVSFLLGHRLVRLMLEV